MYRREAKNQLTMDEFMLPFGGKLLADNRWVRLAKLMLWEVVEEEYSKSMCEEEGRQSLPARLAYGAIHLKEQEGLTDERTVEYLQENPYAQYFVGQKEFRKEALFDASMMVHFRKRFPPEAIQRINEALYKRVQPKAKEPPPDSGSSSEKEQPASPKEEPQNEERIVSLRQPHVRCIVRGKARTRYEFGQKLHLSVVNGFTFLEHQSWDNFHEGAQLIAVAERYRQRFGVYPKAILADKIYRNRENLRFCKENDIRLSGPRLGRPPKEGAQADQSQAYKDSCQRNEIEGRNGISKRRYGLDLIMSTLPETAMTEAALNVLVMNAAHLLRMLLRLLRRVLPRSLARLRYVYITA